MNLPQRSNSDRHPNLEGLLRLAEHADLLDDPEVQDLLTTAAAISDTRLKQQIKKALTIRATQETAQPFDTTTTRVPAINDNVTLGTTINGSNYALKQDDFTQHFLAVGQSGSGKTTLFYNLMNRIEEAFWAFDLKQDYRHLIGQDEVLVLPWNRLKFNPLKPPSGVSPRRWAQVLSEIFGHATALLSGSKNYLLKKLIELYKLYNLFDTVSMPYPSPHELELLIKKDTMNYMRKSSNYRETVLNRLESMNLVAGTVFDCSQGYSIEELLSRNVVFEFDGLSRDVQNFLMEVLFAYVYEYRLSENQRDTGLSHVFFLDEGKRVFSVYKERQDASGIPEIDELTAKMREFGEGLVVADQEASKLTDSIKANTYTKVLLPTGDRKQFDAVADSMDLSERQKEFAQGLDTGEAVIQVGNSSPVPVKLHNYSIEKDVSDELLRKQQAEKWSQLSHEPRETTQSFDQRIADEPRDEVEEPEIVDDPTREVELSHSAEKLLEDVVENPFRPLTERYQDFSSWHKGNEVKQELVDNGVVVEREAKTSEKGKTKLLEITEKGREHIEGELNIEFEREGRGGIVHRYWQERIKEAFEELGWTAKLEMFNADVYVNMGNTELVIEVAMADNPREVEHAKQHLEAGFDAVWIVARNQEILDGLKQRIEKKGLMSDRVAFRPFRQFKEPENLAF